MFELQSKYTGYEPISNDEEALFPPAPRKASNLNAWSVASALLVVAGTTVLLSTVSIPSTGIKPSFNAAGSINFGFKRVNYDALPYFDKTSDDLLKYKFLSKYVALVEPHAEMEFYMYESTEYDVEYSVCDKSHSCTTGTWFAKDKKSTKSIKFDCLAYDTLSVEIKQYDSSKNLVDSVSGDAVCLYVRREMRKLTSEDLDKFISASAKLNAISDAEGQGVYGQKYLSASSLVKYHHFNAVQQNQDHIHEGNGFTIQHVKLTNIFEASVQAVDPSIAMPYWDFTIDSSEGLTTNVATIFTDKMYGQNYQPTDVSGWTYKDDLIENGRIMNGLWKDLKVEMNPYPGSPYEFGYGYMRAPWNMNPSPYLSRYTHIETESNAGYSYMPTCSNHYDILQYDDQMDFYYMVSYAPHGTLHILEGGFYGCDLLQPLVDAGYITDYNAVCYFWVFTLKELYRAGAITPNTGCTPAENLQDSYCGYKITDSSSFYPTLRGMLQAGLNLTMEGLEEAFMDFVQNDGSKIFPGDHLESASPADPSFWVIHPTLERLLHAKLLAGGFEGDGEWPTSTKKDYICSKSTCYENGKKSSYSDCCYGHYQDDQLYDGLAGSTKAYFGPTNREVESATDSTSMDYSMSYIYDNFEWDHCEEDFQTLLQDMYDDMQAVESGDMTAVRKVPRPASQDAARARKEQIVKNGNAYEASL